MGSQKHILLVEDTPELAENISDVLKMEGYTVDVLNDGTEAMKILTDHSIKPDLIITDLVMPKMTGIELVTAVRELKSTSHIPVIILTANAMEESVKKGLAAGANLYLKKPCEIEYLLNSIESLLNKVDD